MSAKLASATQKSAGIPNGMRTATVAAVTDTSITINVNGGLFSSGVGVVSSYAPVVGDTVAVFRQDSSWMILGRTSARNAWTRFADLGYQNGWTDRGVGYPFGAYRVTASEVQLVGQIRNPGTPSSPSVIVAGLPAPPGEVAGIIAAQGATRPSLHVDASGQLLLYDITAGAGVFLQFSGSYPLDFPVS